MAFNKQGAMMKVQGQRLYLPVNARIVWFVGEHPDWSITTEPVTIDHEKQFAVFRAEIHDPNGRLMATGYKKEDVKGFGDYIEKAEKGAIGRALALRGYGTDGDGDGDYIVDAPVGGDDAPRGGYIAPPQQRNGNGNNFRENAGGFNKDSDDSAARELKSLGGDVTAARERLWGSTAEGKENYKAWLSGEFGIETLQGQTIGVIKDVLAKLLGYEKAAAKASAPGPATATAKNDALKNAPAKGKSPAPATAPPPLGDNDDPFADPD